MLATPATVLPTGTGWSYEFKWDGVRALVDISPERFRITGRNESDVTIAYPELAGLARDGDDALIDGEIVALRDGRPSFEALQPRMHVRNKRAAAALARDNPVVFMAFDLLRCYGVDLTERPYRERRATLERWLEERTDWTVSPVFDDGPATELAARENGLEGVVAKRLDSRYHPGRRDPGWQKLRFAASGDFVVVGYEASPDHPGELSSLLLAGRDGDGLGFAGKVGSGLDARTVRHLQSSLTVTDTPPVTSPGALRGRLTTWVTPDTVVEVRFTEWTSDRRLRHPVFLRVRTDKDTPDPLPERDDGR